LFIYINIYFGEFQRGSYIISENVGRVLRKCRDFWGIPKNHHLGIYVTDSNEPATSKIGQPSKNLKYIEGKKE